MATEDKPAKKVERFTNNHLAINLLTTREAWLRKMVDPRKDIFAECGHPETIETKDYADAYDRGDVAQRVVNLYPEETWQVSPTVAQNEEEEDTEFEAAWDALEKEHHLWSYLQRVDILSGIGRFGVLLLGFSDGKSLREEAAGSNLKLIYVRPFEELLVDIATLEKDVSNPRFGKPTHYNIQFVDAGTITGETQTARAEKVHWTRIVHVADMRQNSDVYGTPRMKAVFNRLLDLRKITGGSGEMFWKGGFPGISLEAANPDEDVTLDADATREEMDRYQNGLQRYIALVGMTAKSLSPQVADPTPHVDVQLKLIATAMSVPWRTFIGSESAELASSQDAKAWNKRVMRRQNEYVTPFIIVPLIERLQAVGVLPAAEEYEVKWPDPNAPSDLEKAQVAASKTEALAKYVSTGIDAIFPPFQYLTLVCGMTDEEAKGVLDEAGDRIEELTPEFADERDEIKGEAGLGRDIKREAAKKPVVVAPGAPKPPVA